MKVNIVGGGPAGLYLGLLLRKGDPSREVVIRERHAPGQTFGWGVVFSDQTLTYLSEADRPTHDAIVDAFCTWEDVRVVHRGEPVDVGGNHFSGIARIELLRILQERCRELGCDLRFESEVADPAPLADDADLLVGADGVGSVVRETWADDLEPELARGRNPYIWLGTPRLFPALTLIFRPTEDGLFTAHAYQFDDEMSTFIVECEPEALEATGLEEAPVEETIAHLRGVFADDLASEPLLSNDSRWIRFLRVSNRRWHRENVVLLGDALHTAHFSIGSGTKLALEDAIALAGAIDGHAGDVPAALEAFEAERRPTVERLQAAAAESRRWFERAADHLHLDPVCFAHEVMTRSGRVDHANLEERDPAFAALYERYCRRHGEPV